MSENKKDEKTPSVVVLFKKEDKKNDDESQVIEVESTPDDDLANVSSIIDLGSEKLPEKVRDEAVFLKDRKYLMGDLLGKGSWAEVKELLDMESLERRAVKISRQKKHHLAGSSEERRHFNSVLFEGKILIKLNHINIIKVIETIHKNDPNDRFFTIWIIKEYCASSVEEIRKSRVDYKLPFSQSVVLFKQLINGLEYLHSNRIIHLDIKPANLLICTSHNLKITDFGCAVQLDLFAPNDQLTSGPGSPAFSPPETLTLDINVTFSGSKIDIWAAGVTLYLMITGIYPFVDENSTVDILHQTIMDTRGEPRVTPEMVKNPDLYRFLRRIFNTDPNKRVTIHEIKHDLWYQLSYEYNEWDDIPPRGLFGDRYRSMSVTPYLHELHYPLPSEKSVVMLTEDEAVDFNRKKKIPMVRSNRSPSPSSKSPKAKSFFQKMKQRFNFW